MTNEEKAVEFDKRANNKQVNIYAWTLQMAEWKDHQFKEYLEKFIFQCETTARTVVAYDLYAAERNRTYAECARIIINEFFKED